MKFKICFFVVTACTFSHASSVWDSVTRDLKLPSGLNSSQAASTPPPILSFAPGASVGVDYVAIPPQHGLKSWSTSVCASSPIAQLPLGHGFSIQSDGLAGINLRHSALTAGYSADLAYQFTIATPSRNLSFVFKAGGAQLFGAGVSPVPGVHGSASLQIALR
jgi:hypothetical protein